MILCLFVMIVAVVHATTADERNSNCSALPNSFNGFGFEVVLAKLDYLQHQLQELGHNFTSQQTTCVNPGTKNQIPEDREQSQQDKLPTETLQSCRNKDDQKPSKVFCEEQLFGGGWLVFQSRFDGSLDFYRNWTEYRQGFGSIDGEFWMGLERLHQLTSQQPHELLIELKTATGELGYAQYSTFEIDSEAEKYKLKRLGTYNGTAGDSLTYQLNQKFSTVDQDNDSYKFQCAVQFEGAWWYNACHYSNLNGSYMRGKVASKSMCWNSFKNQCIGLASTRMMIRPVNKNS